MFRSSHSIIRKNAGETSTYNAIEDQLKKDQLIQKIKTINPKAGRTVNVKNLRTGVIYTLPMTSNINLEYAKIYGELLLSGWELV